MATPPQYLAVDRFGSGSDTVQPLRLTGAIPASIGTAFGNDATHVSTYQNRNGIIQFGGEIYTSDRLAVYQKDDPTILTGTWTSVLTFVSPISSGVATGFYPYVTTDGKSGIFMNQQDSTSTSRLVTFDGTTWAESGAISMGTSTTKRVEVMYQNKLHTISSAGSNQTTHIIYDPVAFTATAGGAFDGATGQFASELVVYEDRLFALYGKSGNYTLAEYTNVWVDRVTVTGFTAGANSGLFGAVLDDGSMFFIFPDFGATDDDRGFGCVEFDSDLTLTDRTSARLHDDLIPVNKGGTSSLTSAILDDYRVHASYDPDTTPGTSQPWIWIAANGNAGTPFSLYEWPTTAGQMLLDSSGGDIANSMPTGYQHGERIWTPNDLDIWIESTDFGLGISKILFRASGDAGTGDKVVTFRFTSEQGAPTTVQATLTGAVTVESVDGTEAPVGTAIRVGNSITGLDANGTVLYSCFWDVTADVPGNRAQLTPFISV